MTDSPRHISQLKPADRARADQTVRDALLAIVATQGKPVQISLAQLDQFADTHRLVLESDGLVLTLRAEKAPLMIEPDRPTLTN